MKLSLGITPRDYSAAGGVTYDADALAYFTANTTITSSADKNAINTFYLGLKSDGIYTKMKAMYLPIWGSAASSKWNLINPLDTNAAFRLTFSTGWTFSTGGALPNGTSAYADTFLIPNTNLTSNSHHLSFYSRTNNTTTGYELACTSVQASSTQYGYMLLAAREAATSYYQQQTQNINSITPSEANTLGFYNGSRTSSTSFKAFKNGVLRGTNTNTASGIASYLAINSLYLGAYNLNNNGAISTINYSNRQCSFASIGNGLTDAEASNFYTRVNTLMTHFGINV